MSNEITLMLPTFLEGRKLKRGIISSLITGFISLAYEGISSFLHYKGYKALKKVIKAEENKLDLQRNRVFHLEDSMVMCGTYSSDTLEQLIETVHGMHN